MFNMSKELVIVLAIFLVIFVPRQLPQLGKMLGKTMRCLREGLEGYQDAGSKRSTDEAIEETQSQAPVIPWCHVACPIRAAAAGRLLAGLSSQYGQ